MARAIDLTEEIKEYLDEDFPNLYDAARALLDLSKDPDESEDYESGGEEDDGFVAESYNNEPAQPMSELDKEIQAEERYLQREKMERLLQIQERKLQKMEKEYEEVSDGSDYVKLAQDIQRQIAEGVLRIKEEKEIEALKQLAWFLGLGP